MVSTELVAVVRRAAMVSALACGVGMLSGCGGSDEPAANKQPASGQHDHEHDHGRDHHGHDHPPHGPHGGHLVELEGTAEYHAEWVHDDDANRVTVYILDESAQKERPISAEHVVIETRIVGADAKQYQLEAVDRSLADPPVTARFEIVDPELLAALSVGEGVESALLFEADGKTFRGPIEHTGGHDH